MTSLALARLTRFAIVLCTAGVVCTPISRALGQSAKPLGAMSSSVRTLRDSVVQIAKEQLGKRYLLGGQGPERGFDCSGLVRYVMSALNVGMPRTARQQARIGLGLARDTSQLLPGDLLTFARSKRAVSHIGIYIGGGKYIHASSGAGRVIESSIDRPRSSLNKIWHDARRILSLDDTTQTIVAVAASKAGGQP